MIKRLKNAIRYWTPDASLLSGFAKSIFQRRSLPPGALTPIFRHKKLDRKWLLRAVAVHGPIVKAYAWNRIFISIVGNAEAKSFLKANESKCTLKTMDVTSMVPRGYLRQMCPADHQTYRERIMRALHATSIDEAREDLNKFCLDELAGYVSAGNSEAEVFTRTLDRMATNMLVRLFFGTPPASLLLRKLADHFHAMGPKRLIWTPGEKQEDAFHGIEQILKQSSPEFDKNCVWNYLQESDQLDDTTVGNLIYMVEMGRFDIYSMFRWVVYFCSTSPNWLDELAEEQDWDRLGTISRAIIFETLRLEQSERLVRDVHEDIDFMGHLIPKNSVVGLSLWESHKNESVFDSPFEFNPERFIRTKYSSDDYAPFGIGKHVCPVGDISIRLGSLFVEALARNFSVIPVEAGPAHRGAYHWEPPKSFSVQLTAR